ncbi:hypothetical protein ROHU_024679 [Labeo rohita]|uniref:Uncharacterized protein n=1 Tax=Labeo rohita TaxID=84645 RepID=A0A498MNF0_LABRO|nr:hypothetical protein ROHU_024679 [Labeo rohita]
MKKPLQLLLFPSLHPVQLCRWEWYVSLGQVPKIAGIRLRSADSDAAGESAFECTPEMNSTHYRSLPQTPRQRQDYYHTFRLARGLENYPSSGLIVFPNYLSMTSLTFSATEQQILQKNKFLGTSKQYHCRNPNGMGMAHPEKSLWTRAFIMHPLPFYESHSTTQRQGLQPNAIPTDRALLQGYSTTVYPYCPRSSASH